MVATSGRRRSSPPGPPLRRHFKRGGGGGGGTGSNIAGQQYRGPIWTEERFSSGKAVTARVLVSARGDYLVEIEARDPTRQTSGRHQRAAAAGREGCAPDVSPSCPAGGMSGGEAGGSSARGVLRLELRAPELRAVFRGLDCRRKQRRESSMESLLAPDRRVELCRWGTLRGGGACRFAWRKYHVVFWRLGASLGWDKVPLSLR